MTMWNALTEFTKELFGVDVEGGGLPEPVHANRVIVGSGISAEFHEATRAVTLSTTFDPDSLPRWRDLVNVDYSALDTTTFEADGAVTIGGVGYVVAGLANRYSGTTMGLTSGKGLRLPLPVSGSTSATRLQGYMDLPRIGFPLPSVCVNHVPVRAVFRLHSWETGLSNKPCPTLAFCYPSATAITCQVAQMRALAGDDPATATKWSLHRRNNGNSVSDFSSDIALASGANILGMCATHGVGGSQPIELLSGVESATPITDLNGLVTIANSYGLIDNGMDPATRGQAQNWQIALCAAAVTTAERHIYIDRFRVQAFY